MATAEVSDFFGKLQGGDPTQVDALLQELGPWLRRVIRLRLVDGRLRRIMDTTDVYHSLIEDFLRQKASREPSAETTAGLSAYLAAAVLHKIQTRLRKERRHAGSLPSHQESFGKSQPDVAQELEERDFFDAVRCRLGEETRRLLDLSARGLTWNEIAREVGGNPDALRMRLRRDIARVLSQFGEELLHAG